MKTKLLCAICSILLAGCGKTVSENQPTSSRDAPAKSGINVAQVIASAQAPQPVGKEAPLKIQGLYLGMDIHEVPGAMMDMLAERGLPGFGFTEVLKIGGGAQCVLLYSKPFLAAIEARLRERYSEAVARGKANGELLTSCINSDGVLVVKANAGREVSSIEFNDVKDMFNEKVASPTEFAKDLSKEFHIPQLKPNATRTAWSYTSPDGDKVEVTTKEVLGIPMVRLTMSAP